MYEVRHIHRTIGFTGTDGWDSGAERINDLVQVWGYLVGNTNLQLLAVAATAATATPSSPAFPPKHGLASTSRHLGGAFGRWVRCALRSCRGGEQGLGRRGFLRSDLN